MLPFKSRRTSQPQDLAQIDTSVFDPDLLLLGSIGPVNLGKGPKTITGVPSAYKATRNGKSFYFNGASPGRLYTSVPAPVYVAPEFTFVVAYTPDAAPSSATYSAVIYSSYLLLSWDHGAAPSQGVVQWQDTGGIWSSIPLLSKTGGKSTTVCVTMKNGTLSVYQDGAYCGSQAGVTINSAGDFWDFGERGNGNGFWWPGSIELAATSTKFVSTAFARDISANPWQLFKPQSRTLWESDAVGGGGPATVIPIGQQATGAVGTVTATGAARAYPLGVQATSAVGTPVVVAGGSAIAMPLGVQAVGSVGALIAAGQAWRVAGGVSASGAVGTPVVLSGSSAIATPAGLQAVGSTGTPVATGACRTYPLGLTGYWSAGTPIAVPGVSGVAVAYPSGVQVGGYVGAPAAKGAAIALAQGVYATGQVGFPVAGLISIIPPGLVKFVPDAASYAFIPGTDAYSFEVHT